MTTDRLTAAVSAEVLAVTQRRRELLQSIAETARAIFLAQAASIAILDDGEREFAFETVAGKGTELVGERFSAGQGIAGAVAQSGEPVIIDDLTRDARFERSIAESTGYVPTAMMVAPLLREDRTLGVLSVLDRGETGRRPLEELTLLVAFADQAAIAIEVSEAARRAASLLAGAGSDADSVVALVRRLESLKDERREAGLRLLAALDDLLA